MTLREQIFTDLKQVSDLRLLYQIFEFIQILKKNVIEPRGNRDLVLQFAGTLPDKETAELKKMIDEEFSGIEGDW